MSLVMPPGLTPVGGRPLARALTAAVLAMPLVIATVALVPALLICPFLTGAHRRLALRLLASLQQWTNVLSPPVRRKARLAGLGGLRVRALCS
jgi:hypothetical protein